MMGVEGGHRLVDRYMPTGAMPSFRRVRAGSEFTAVPDMAGGGGPVLDDGQGCPHLDAGMLLEPIDERLADEIRQSLHLDQGGGTP
jgi:hypothetical protein